MKRVLRPKLPKTLFAPCAALGTFAATSVFPVFDSFKPTIEDIANIEEFSGTLFNHDDSKHIVYFGDEVSFVEQIILECSSQQWEEGWIYVPVAQKGYEVGVQAHIEINGYGDLIRTVHFSTEMVKALRKSYQGEQLIFYHAHLPPETIQKIDFNSLTEKVLEVVEDPLVVKDRRKLVTSHDFLPKTRPSICDFESDYTHRLPNEISAVTSAQGATYFSHEPNYTYSGPGTLFGELRREPRIVSVITDDNWTIVTGDNIDEAIRVRDELFNK